MNHFIVHFLRRLSAVLGLACGLAVLPAAGQFPATLQSVTGPSGTVTAPHFVIGSDAGNPAASRDKIPVTASVRFTRTDASTAESFVYRLTGELINPGGVAVVLASGSTLLGGPATTVSMAAGTASVTRTFSLALDPGVDLGAGSAFTIRCNVQRGLPLTINGVTSYTWLASAGPASSAAFTTVHFTELAANSSTRNTRGYFRGTATWTKTFALGSASQALQKQFTLNVPGTLARYDPGDSAKLFSIRFTTTVTDSLGNNVPLENGGVSTQNVIINAFNSGTPNTPALTNLTLTPNFTPSGQLDSRNRTFRVSVRMDHQEAVPSSYQGAATTQSTSLQRLLHFNGTLLFDTLSTRFSSITNSPVAGTLGTNLVNTVVNVPSGTIPGFPKYSFGSGGDMGVELFSNGDAKVTSGARPVVVAEGGRIEAVFGGIMVSYPSTTLRNSGILSGSIVVHLPQGLGYTAARASSSGRYNSTVIFPGQPLASSDFRHTGLLKQTTPPDAWVFDEARPLLYRTVGVQFAQGGSLTFESNSVEWIHGQALDQLEAQQQQTTAMRYRLTNDGHLRYARINTNRDIEFRAHADGSARTHWANLDVAPGFFRAHFPKDAWCVWTSAGLIRIRNGVFSSDSEASGALGVTVAYDGTCETDKCGPAPGAAADSVTLSPVSGKFRYTPSGGIYAAATLNAKMLRWGIRGDGTAAHRTDTFSQAEFHAPGHQLYQSDQPLASSGPLMGVAATLSPASLLLAGHDAANHLAPVYFGSTRYRDGVGAYAGATMTVAGAGRIGASRLADAANEYPYMLMEGVSKYYVRPSGVSGRHAAGDDSFQPNLQLYGYNFGIKRFQLTFLSNANEKSWINGGVNVPYPSQFSQDFLGLSLTCTGALGPAEIDPKDSGTKPLAYWNGSFTPIRMNFAPVAGGGCYGPRFLSVGLVSGAANIPTPLFGSLAFLPSGSIAPLAADIEGVDGRLGLPASLPFDGPGNERYQLTPVSKLYFNDPFAANAPSSGFVGFHALCGVPFFEDLKVHLMTSAQAGVPAPVHLTSSWTEGGETAFSNKTFDSSHRGLPPGTPMSHYQSSIDFSPRAAQSLFGVVPLNYPLKWSSAGRYFTSWGPVTSPLLVVTAKHQVDYLSAEHAEISFGAQYAGLPKINLVSAAIDLADDQLGASRALATAATAAVAATLNQGIGELGNLVNDNMEKLLDQAVDAIEAQAIDPLYEAISDSYTKAAGVRTYDQWVNTNTGDLKKAFDLHLSSLADDSVKGRLNQLAAATTDASSLLHRVKQGVERGILAIDSVSARIKLVNGVAVFDNPAAGVNLDGILVKVGEDRPIIQRLVGNLIRELAPPELAALITSTSGQLTQEINAELQAILTKSEPAIDRINQTLMEARSYLMLVHARLQAGGDVLISFQQIINNASGEINQIVLGIRTAAYDFIHQISVAATQPGDQLLGQVGNLLDEFDKEEFVAFIRAELRDRLLASNFIQQIQYDLRRQLSEVDIAIRSAIDSGFGEVSRMCKDLIKESLGPIDDSINSLLGEVSDAVGAGSLDGYAHIQGDTLRRLRIDAKVQFKIPEEMSLQAYFEMLCYDSDSVVGSSTCTSAGERTVEVKIGALDVPLDWASPDLRADLEVRFAMQTQPDVRPMGIGGSLIMTGGELDFQSLKITAFSAGIAVGKTECYLAASAKMVISDYAAGGGIFFGRTCSLDPLRMVDPDVGSLLGQPPFTGAYVYGEAWIPISEVLLGIPSSCLFRISAGVGAGAFYFAEGPTFGGRMLLGVSGEALCIVSIRGEVAMTGVMNGGSLRFRGRGTLTGTAGYCPFCVNFRESATITYQGGAWDIDY